MLPGLKGDNMNNNSFLAECFSRLLWEGAGKRGFEYEETLSLALSNAGFEVAAAAGNNNSISDLGFTAHGISVAAEVKLDHEAFLGAVRKDQIQSLIYDPSDPDGDVFIGSPYPDSYIKDEIVAIIDFMNSSPAVREKFEKLVGIFEPYRKLPWDLGKGFGNDRGPDRGGSQEARDFYLIIRNEQRENRQAEFPIPHGRTPLPPGGKQISNPSTGAKITAAKMREIMSNKQGPNGAETSYIFVGHGRPAAVSGELYTLIPGLDPLNTGAPLYAPGSVGIEIRFASGGGRKKGRAYSFNFKMKSAGAPNRGLHFDNANEMIDLLSQGAGDMRITEQKLRQMVRNVLKGKDLEFVKAWRGTQKSQDIGWAYIKTNRGVFMALESKLDVWGPVPRNHKKVSSSRQPVKKKANEEQTAALVNFWKENTPRNGAAEALAKSDKEKADKAAARKKQDTPENREALRKRRQKWKEESKAAGYGSKKKKKKGSGFGEYAGNGDKDNPGTAF